MFLHKRLLKPATALLVVVFGVALFTLPATSLSTGSPGVPSEYQASRGESSTPSGLLFIENAGQWPEAARFQAWGSPAGVGTTWLAEDAIWVVVAGGKSPVASGKLQVAGSEAPSDRPTDLLPATVQPATLTALKLTFPGANLDVRIEPLEPLTTTVSYFLGHDPAQWRPDVPVYDGVRYADLYPGVDLALDSAGRAGGIAPLPAAYTAAVDLRRAARGEKRAQNHTECIGGYV